MKSKGPKSTYGILKSELDVYKSALLAAGVPKRIVRELKLGPELDWYIYLVLICNPPVPWKWIDKAIAEMKFKYGAQVYEQQNLLETLPDFQRPPVKANEE